MTTWGIFNRPVFERFQAYRTVIIALTSQLDDDSTTPLGNLTVSFSYYWRGEGSRFAGSAVETAVTIPLCGSCHDICNNRFWEVKISILS